MECHHVVSEYDHAIKLSIDSSDAYSNISILNNRIDQPLLDMTDESPTPLGTSIPSREHAISVHLPTWKDVVGVGSGDVKTLNALNNGYPRSNLHSAVLKLAKRCKDEYFCSFADEIGLHLFPDHASAKACESYITSATDLVRTHKMTFHGSPRPCHDCQHEKLAPLWAVVYPESSRVAAAGFWRLTGLGISSRLAEAYLGHMDSTDPTHLSRAPKTLNVHDSHPTVYDKLRERIASMLTRATIVPPFHKLVNPSDVFLFPSGMSTIYHVHHMLLQWRNGGSVMMGFPYELTLKILETYGPSCKVYSSNSNNDLDKLEQYLIQKASDRTTEATLQAIWCECPSNPLLWAHDLQKVRRLADQYDLAVIVDDTIGSSANVDVLNVADVVVTSLTKSFSGFADVMAGSATLNPNSRYYQEFRRLLTASYVNNLYINDAVKLELNSRTYLERVAITNETAEYLVDNLRPLVSGSANELSNGATRSEDKVINAVYYPKGSPSMCNYAQQMRRTTDSFKPGYGCLFTIEFGSVDVAGRFYDSLDLHKGPSLGADVTLVLPYVQMVLQREKEWAAGHGLRETIVRVSVGLEDKHDLLRRLKSALAAAVR